MWIRILQKLFPLFIGTNVHDDAAFVTLAVIAPEAAHGSNFLHLDFWISAKNNWYEMTIHE